jgi:surface antigen
MTGRAWRVILALFVILTSAAPALAEQCVSFARRTSGVELRGDARDWWQAAAGHYTRGVRPQTGAVMVFKATKKMKRGHVAVVRQVVDSRHIRIDHANWPRGRRTFNATAIDVSLDNDWSEVKVALDPNKLVWVRTNPVHGFIYADDLRVASVPQTPVRQPPIAPMEQHSVTVAALPEAQPAGPVHHPAPPAASQPTTTRIVATRATTPLPTQPMPTVAAATVTASAPAVNPALSAMDLNARTLARLRGQTANNAAHSGDATRS